MKQAFASVIVSLLFAGCEMQAQTGRQIVIWGQGDNLISAARTPSEDYRGLSSVYVNPSFGGIFSSPNTASTWSFVGNVPINDVLSPNVITSLNVFGDSIAVAANYGVQRATQGFGYLTAAALGAPVGSNFAAAGATMNGFVGQAYRVAATAETASIAIVGSNDADEGVPITQYLNGLGTFSTWLGLQSGMRKTVAGMVFSGGWSSGAVNGLAVRFSSTAGDKATANGIQGTTIYVGTTYYRTIISSFTVKVDGTTCFTASSVTVSADQTSQLVRCSGLSPGSHTVVIAPTINGQDAVISWVGGNGGAVGALPLVIIGNTLPRKGLTARISAQNKATARYIANLQADGLNIVYADTNSVLNLTAVPTQYDPQLIHPNALGNALVTKAFLNAIYTSNKIANLRRTTLHR